MTTAEPPKHIKMDIMRQRLEVPSTTSKYWIQVTKFINSVQAKIESCESLEEAFDILCLEGFERAKNKGWLARCFQIMSAKKITCAGYAVVSYGDQVELAI